MLAATDAAEMEQMMAAEPRATPSPSPARPAERGTAPRGIRSCRDGALTGLSNRAHLLSGRRVAGLPLRAAGRAVVTDGH
jgi:hypothetical protein